MNRPTSAVIARIQLIEAPYLNEFINWYTYCLGFDRVYLVNTEPEHKERILAAIESGLRGQLTLLDCPVSKAQQNALVRYYPQLIREAVRERFLLNVDCDELLFLPPAFAKIGDFLQTHAEFGAFRFHWLNVASAENFTPSMVSLLTAEKPLGHDGKNVKMMGDVAQFSRIDHHSIEGASRIADFPFGKNDIGQTPFIVHFIARSKTHTILKILHQEINSLKSKKSPLNRPDYIKSILLAPDRLTLAQVPPRILLHMIELLQSKRANLLTVDTFPQLKAEPAISADEASMRILESMFTESLSSLDISKKQVDEILHRNLATLFDASRLRHTFSQIPYTTANPMLARLVPVLSRQDATENMAAKTRRRHPPARPVTAPQSERGGILDYEVVLHLGRPKTASTSLQRLFAENATTLARNCGIYVGQPFRDPKFGHWRVSFDPNWLARRTERNPRAVAAGGGSFQGPLLRLAELSKAPNATEAVRRAFQLELVPPRSRLLISDESIRIEQVPLLLRFFRLSEVLVVVREPCAWITSSVRQLLRSRSEEDSKPEEFAERLFRGESWNPEVYVTRLAKALQRSDRQSRDLEKTGKTSLPWEDFLAKVRLYAFEEASFSPAKVLGDLAGEEAHFLRDIPDVRLNVRSEGGSRPQVVSEEMRQNIKAKLRANTGLIKRCRVSEQAVRAIELYCEAM